MDNQTINILRSIYMYLIMKLLNIIYPRNKKKVKQISYDDVKMLLRINEDVGKSILIRKFEKEELQFICNQLKTDSVFIDIGANTGFFSLMIAAKSPDIKVYSFDPIKLNTSLLAASCEINGFDNVVISQTCVGSHNGIVDFSISSDSAYSSINFSGRKSIEKKIHLPIITLDEFVIKNGLKRIDFIKIDVEGAEKLVLLGANLVLSTVPLRPKLIMIELYDINLKAFNTSVIEIIEIMKSKSYKPLILKDGVLVDFEYKTHANIFYNIFFEDVSLCI